MNEQALTRGDVKRTLLRFTLPFVAATLLQYLYGAADLAIVGWFSDAAGMAAVNTGCQVMQGVTYGILGLATGGTVLIGQYAGAGRREDVEKTIGTMFTFFSILAVALTIALTLSTNTIITLMGVPDEAVVPARQYFFICACGTVFITGYNMVSAILRGLGDSRRPMVFIFVACVLNVAGDLLLVGVFHMGAAGAAVATVAAQGVSLLLSVCVLRKRDFPFDFKLKSFGMKLQKVWLIVKLGGPVALQDILVTVSFLLITASVNPLGVPQAAAVGVTERVISFCMLAPVAFQSAISAMTAQNMGAARPDRAREALRCGLLCSLLFGAVACLLLQLFPHGAAALFAKDEVVIYHSALYLRSYGFDCVLVPFVFCLNGFFGGCGRTLFVMVNALTATFLIRVPVVMLLAPMPGVTLYELGFAAPAASCLQVALQLVYLKLGRWKRGVIHTGGGPQLSAR